jgi:Tectonin domain
MKRHAAKSLAIVLALVLGMACTQSAPAQTFKKVKVNGNAPIMQVASGGNSAWALASNGNPYIFNGKNFVLANSISLSQIAVGGGNAVQADVVWALNSSGNVYRATKNGSSWTFSQVPGVLDLIEVGPGYHDKCHPYEVWGLNTGSQIYRYNYCTSQFDQQSGFLCDIHVGGGYVWGAQCGPNVFKFNFSTGVFDQIADPFGAFPQLAVGPNGGVWAIDTGNQSVAQYDPFSTFQYVIGCCSQQIQAGGDGVWILSGNQILRLDPSTLLYADVPGSLDSISVGSGGGVWGINSSHQVFAFSTP